MKLGPRIGTHSVRLGPALGDPFTPPGSTTLTVAMTDSADPVITSVNYDYAVVVTNTGGNSASTVVCTVTLDPQSTYVSSSGTGWATGHSAGVVTCTRAALGIGAAPTITITVTSSATAETSSAQADASAFNASAASPSVQTTVVNLVAKDATSGIRAPADATQWTNFRAYMALTAANPSALWLLQEASGNPADSIGTFTLTASGVPAYQQTITGWARKAINTNGDGGSSGLRNTDAGLPDIATNSLMLLAYVDMPLAAGAAVRNHIEFGTVATRCALEFTTAAKVRARSAATTVDGTATPTSAVRPLLLKCDRTGSVVTAYTDQEKLTPTFGGTMAGQQLAIMSVLTGQQSAVGGYLYAAAWFNANAELSDANVRSLLQALGWTILW